MKKTLASETARMASELGLGPIPGLTAPSKSRIIKKMPFSKEMKKILRMAGRESYEIAALEEQAGFMQEMEKNWRVATVADFSEIKKGDLIAFVYKDDDESIVWRGNGILPVDVVAGESNGEMVAEGWSFSLRELENHSSETVLKDVTNCDTSWTLFIPKKQKTKS